MIAVVCSWCPDSEEKTAALKAAGFEVSDGICKKCLRNVVDDLGDVVDNVGKDLEDGGDVVLRQPRRRDS